MKVIDKQNWDRNQAYEFFSGVDYPFYSVTMPVEVTTVKQFAKSNNLSFYYTMVWVVTKAVNCVDQLKMRIHGDDVVMYKETYPSFTVMQPNESQFRIVTFNSMSDCVSFCNEAKQRAEQQKEFINFSVQSDKLIYISCTPWFDFTALTNERNFDKDDAIPRIAWGKYYEQNGGLWVHISIEVNHRLVDGLHLGKFKQALDDAIAELNNM